MTLSITERKKREAQLKKDLATLNNLVNQRRKREEDMEVREDRIVAKLLARMPKPSAVRIPEKLPKSSRITPEEVMEILQNLPEGFTIPEKLIEGWEQTKRSMWNQIGRKGAYLHGGGDTLVAGPGITLISNSDGTKTISASINNNVLAVTGAIDDSNMTFNTTSTPALLVINGAIYQSTGGAITWSYVAGVITLSTPIGTGGSIFGLK